MAPKRLERVYGFLKLIERLVLRLILSKDTAHFASMYWVKRDSVWNFNLETLPPLASLISTMILQLYLHIWIVSQSCGPFRHEGKIE